MSKDLSGFQKSAPTHFPSTREQNPTSAWDVDLSPFHRLVEEQTKNTSHMVESFLVKIDELIHKIEEGESARAHGEDKSLEYQKRQVREYADLRKALEEMGDQLGEMEALLPKETALLEKLDGMHALLLQLLGFLQTVWTERKLLESKEKSSFSSDALMPEILHQCEKIANSMEHFHGMTAQLEAIHASHYALVEKLQEMNEKQSRQTRIDNIAFWIFVVVSLVLFVWMSLKP